MPFNRLHNDRPDLYLCDDGSHTIILKDSGISYHSKNGALSESAHVFIRNGFNAVADRELHILEMGMGSGLNVLLTALEAGKQGITVHYTAIELFPLDLELARSLNYPQLLNGSERLFQSIHDGPWDQFYPVGAKLQLMKKQEDFCSAVLDEGPFNLVYFDAFAPDDQNELWQPGIWDKLYIAMAEGAALVTYCAKGQVRRDMIHAGFTVERLEGAPGKREMLRVWKKQ